MDKTALAATVIIAGIIAGVIVYAASNQEFARSIGMDKVLGQGIVQEAKTTNQTAYDDQTLMTFVRDNMVTKAEQVDKNTIMVSYDDRTRETETFKVFYYSVFEAPGLVATAEKKSNFQFPLKFSNDLNTGSGRFWLAFHAKHAQFPGQLLEWNLAVTCDETGCRSTLQDLPSKYRINVEEFDKYQK